MKKQISICFFLAILVIILALLFVKFSNEDSYDSSKKTTEDSETNTDTEESIKINKEYVTYYFYLKNDEGSVCVYDVKTQTLYMDTGIKAKSLPTEIQQELESGIFFATEEELFDFLENYSS